MQGIAVAVLSEDRERLGMLQHRLESTSLGRPVFSHGSFPTGPTDPILRQIQDLRADVVLLDMDPARLARATAAIELLKSNTNDLAIFAVGEMSHPPAIVAAMRAGACEYLERDGDPASLQEALARLAASRSRMQNAGGRARVFTFLNAKGGSGATTIAVNTALALQENHGPTVLVDFGLLGHAALHLNVRPSFGLIDALQNLHRMDTGLLEGFITHCKRDLSLLAGLKQFTPLNPTGAERARLFDLLVSHYRYVVVDCSSRTDDISRLMCDLSDQILLVAQTDVTALWSAGRIQAWLSESNSREKLAMVLNRYKKIPGFTDEDVEKGTNCRVLWKVPNNYHSVAGGIDRGEPVLLADSEISRSVRGLASALIDAGSGEAGASEKEERSDFRKKVTARFLPSPLRAGQ